MQEMSGVVYETPEQHKDLTNARLERDMTDTNTLATALQDHNPFRQGAELTNIMTWVPMTKLMLTRPNILAEISSNQWKENQYLC